MKNIGAFDLKAACSGFIYGLSVADQFIKSGVHEKILLVGAEAQSVAIKFDSEHRDLAVLFGDGAGAVVLQPSDDDTGVLSTHLHSDGSHVEDLWMPAPGSSFRPFISKEIIDDEKHIPYMNGREVFRHAIVRFIEVINECLEKNNLSIKDIDMLIPHQANLRITQMIQKKLGLNDDQVYSNIHKYGNTTAASIPIALAEAINERKISNGDKVVLAAFGSGFAWASAVMEW